MNQPSVWRPTIISGLLTVGLSIWVATAITSPPAAAWLASLRSTHHLNTDSMPPSIGWAVLAGLVGLMCFLTFVGSLWHLWIYYRRERPAQLAAAARREEARRYELELRRREELQAACPHPEKTTTFREDHHFYGGQNEETTYLVTNCASCGKELDSKLSAKYVDGKMSYNRLWYE